MNQRNSNFKMVLEEVIAGLNLLINKDVSENIKGIIQKLGDTIKISHLMGEKAESDFIDFEKVPEIWGSNFLPQLIESILQKKVLEIYYQPFYEEKPYFIRVHPYLLKEYHYRWYLIGLNDSKRELRTYSLDRIWEIKETEISFVPKKFSSKEYFKNTVGIISPQGEPPRIRIKVLKPQAHYLITQPLHPSQSIETENDHNIIFNYRVHPTYEFKTLLLGLGSDVTVLEPAGLRIEIIKELKETIEGYE
jgi:predicted DNA-binding transcriptional regulator YafY